MVNTPLGKQSALARPPLAKSPKSSPTSPNLPKPAPPSPLDPTGYPYLCHTDFVPPAGLEPNSSVIPISADTKGKITGYKKGKDGQEWCGITIPYEDPQRKGWVPLGVLHVGTRKYGELQLEIESKALTTLTADVPLKNETRLSKAIDCFFLACKANASQLTFCPPWFLDMVRNEKRRQGMVSKIVTGMPFKVRNVLEQIDFTVDDLSKALEDIYALRDKDRGKFEKPGVYTIIYSNFKQERGGPSRQTEQYIGKTVNLRDRARIHITNKNTNNKSHHYIAAGDAETAVMGILCEFPKEDVRARATAEQVFTNLFETHLENVFNVTAGGESQDDEELESDQKVNADKLMRYLHDKECAIKMTEVAEESFKRSGWPQACRRTSYGCSRGLNWNTPITELMEFAQIIYVRTQVPAAGITIYRRPPLKVNQGGSLALLKEPMGKIGTSGVAGVFSFSVGRDGPPPGTWVYPVFELMTNGTAHVAPWSRLPSTGPFSDWNEALALAIRIEWRRADGQLVRKYIQVPSPMRQAAPDQHFQGVPLKAYAIAVAIVRFLKQQTYWEKLPRPQWQPDFGVARLKEQNLSWFDQRVVISEIVPDGSKAASQVVGMNEMYQILVAAGLSCPHPYSGNTAWYGPEKSKGTRRVPVPLEHQTTQLRINGAIEPREACDSCYLLSIKSRDLDADGVSRGNTVIPRCVQHKDTNQCVSCASLGRPCTWTLSVTRCPLTDPKVLALRPRPFHAEALGPHDTLDPGVMEPDMRELTDQEMEDGIYNAE